MHVSELADLAISGALTTNPLVPGRPAYFSLAVTNLGPDDATSAAVSSKPGGGVSR